MIEITDLAFSYGSNEVLRNITMTLERGKTYGLLGENGVGKTTLLTLLCGLKKPQSGSITVDGRKPFGRAVQLLQDQYYLPDEVAPVPSKTGKWAESLGRMWPGYDHGKFLEIMQLFENDPSVRMDRMSNGQLKKSYIAFALACGTGYLYMDEPTNGLDIPGKSQFRSALLKYTREDSTVVISTHQVRDLENMIDPIIILDRRQVLMNASLQEISARLFFDYGSVLHPDALYSEQTPGGFVQVLHNTTGEESKVNIEALFNTVHKNKELIKRIFNNE